MRTLQLEALLAKTKILIVDDQAYMRKVIRTMLAGFGAKLFFEAGNGAVALAKIIEEPPDVIVVDWDMPQINGFQFVQRIRAPGQFPYPDIPIVMLTGHGERWRVIEATRLGVHEFLLKPVSSSALIERILAALDRRRQMITVQGNYIPAPRRLCVLDVGG